MEVKHRHSNHGLNGIVIAAIFIAVGFILIGRNLGFVNFAMSRILISWQMLLIVLGLVSLLRSHYTGGAILMAIGVFFLTPVIPGLGHIWVVNYWPLIFIAIGIILIINRNHHHEHWHQRWSNNRESSSYICEDGFITSHNSFGSVRQIVLDPVFKGATISNTFGSTIIDLRRTSLSQNETFIDIDSSFGGIEIYVPESWTVKTLVKNSFSGTEDKRYNTMLMDSSKVLIIRGNISFSGLEIKG